MSPPPSLPDLQPEIPSPPAVSLPPPVEKMVIFEVDLLDYAPRGFDIIDVPLRLLGTFFAPAVASDRRHEEYAIATIEPEILPDEIPPFRSLVSDFFVNHLERDVLDAQQWIQSVGLFIFHSAASRKVMVDHTPFDLGSDQFVHFIRHDEGIN
ncbi:hypothetical protein ZWY2020_014812 [Hordeum vulgare]|nr:hypothetical protein ZWY2020_014812 [Hordeum vulgare]